MAVTAPPGVPAGVPAQARTSPPRGSVAQPRAWVGWLFIAPNLVGVVLFTLVPLLSVVALSFTEWNLVSGFGGIEFVGLDNFVNVFRDPGFWNSVVLTLVYAGVSVPLTTILGMALGLALNRDLPGRGALRAIFFVPYIVSVVAIGMTWLMLMNPSAGLVNQVLGALGLQDAPAWFASSYWALPALIVIAVWGGVGYAALIYLSALQDAPTQLYEAADLDGAGAWTKFRVITWPSLVPTTVFLLVTLFIGASQGFGLIALITAGGPGDSTSTLPYYMYQTGFQFYRFGYASAIGMVTFVGVLALTLLTWRAQRGRALHD
ncbi:carbohydrate ABC transporter permease [Pseudonocardia kunmingensis]|uniref:Carbohydrate ABC transporter membrane protein 1 (CUT1 family) n=1 Tax=Pseudonocardia kunmingensis TaxID=630975 RepID=A0A543E0V6_9PSEU|nr:sugar ABC transporter permease [Pseudonocardia kunmingensis]TQM15220.1 carbohydrate ABC transporter membrane protein 1 (CUT1 family) [Pseudonocardia kunmingensis]